MIRRKRPKYGNRKVSGGGNKFASKKEALFFLKLRDLEAAGKIHGLKCQVKFKFPINGQNVRYPESNRELSYIADFEYFTSEGIRKVVDVKGLKTRDYKIKRALMLAVHGILVIEV